MVKNMLQVTKKSIDAICSDMEYYILQSSSKIKECLSNLIKNLLRHTPYNNILEEWHQQLEDSKCDDQKNS